MKINSFVKALLALSIVYFVAMAASIAFAGSRLYLDCDTPEAVGEELDRMGGPYQILAQGPISDRFYITVMGDPKTGAVHLIVLMAYGEGAVACPIYGTAPQKGSPT